MEQKINQVLPFWKTKPLSEMTETEWESLCDGCGKCCLFKIEDMDSGQVHYTDVACRMLDLNNCRCKIYEHRFEVIKDCLSLTYAKLQEIDWLPESCAYRRLNEGKDLPSWHPLISGRQKTVREAGISVCGRALPELSVDLLNINDHVVDWFD